MKIIMLCLICIQSSTVNLTKTCSCFRFKAQPCAQTHRKVQTQSVRVWRKERFIGGEGATWKTQLWEVQSDRSKCGLLGR